MFKKDQKPESFKEVETIIGESIEVNGNFKGNGNIIVEGILNGSLETGGNVFIGDKSKISANISAKELIINGEVTGNILVSGLLTIGASAKINGDIECAQIAVESGSVINGKISMSTSSALV
jgi:cytoskeletal protein CcmA (bactofilin family)